MKISSLDGNLNSKPNKRIELQQNIKINFFYIQLASPAQFECFEQTFSYISTQHKESKRRNNIFCSFRFYFIAL